MDMADISADEYFIHRDMLPEIPEKRKRHCCWFAGQNDGKSRFKSCGPLYWATHETNFVDARIDEVRIRNLFDSGVIKFDLGDG